MKLQKWAITGWISLAVLGMVGFILLVSGSGEHGLAIALRSSARTSAILFCLAFSASALFDIRRNRATAWLRKNRRYVGVAFAVSHFIHLGLIGWMAYSFPDVFFADRGSTEFIGGGLAYILILVMAATSFDRTTRWLGRQRWRILHLVGGWYIWVVFAQRYLKTAVVEPAYVPMAGLFLIVAALRIWRRWAAQTQQSRA